MKVIFGSLLLLVPMSAIGYNADSLLPQIGKVVSHPYSCPEGYKAGLVRENYNGNNRYTRCEKEDAKYYQIRAVATPKGELTEFNLLSKKVECTEDALREELKSLLPTLSKTKFSKKDLPNDQLLVVANADGFVKTKNPSALAVCSKGKMNLNIQIRKLF